MTNESYAGGDEMIEMLLGNSVDVADIDDTLRGVLDRNRDVLSAAGRLYCPADGRHGWIDGNDLVIGDESALIAAGIIEHPPYTSLRKLTTRGAELFAN